MLESRNLKTAVLASGDLAAAYLALILALFFRYGSDEFRAEWPVHVGPFTIAFALWLVIFFIVGLYDLDALHSRIALASRTVEAIVAAFLVSIAVFYAMPKVTIAPKTNLLITILIYVVLFGGWRLATMHFFSRERFRLKVLFLGGGAEAQELCDVLAVNPQLGYACLGVIDPSSTGEIPSCDLIIVSRQLQSLPGLTARLYRKYFDAVLIVDFPSFFERIRHTVPGSALDERWIIDNLAGQEATVYEHVKRLFDILLAVVFSVIALVFFPLIALIIWTTDRGPVFFRQTRVGKGGQPFRIVKFRTMREDAERHGTSFVAEHDARVTGFGRFLRATRLDELPQLWNILRGEMSFVGPRPERPEIEEALAKSIPLFPVRHLVRPGLTGWAQVSAPYAATQEDHLMKLRHDLYYLKYRSLALDAAIVLKTVYSVLKLKGR